MEAIFLLQGKTTSGIEAKRKSLTALGNVTLAGTFGSRPVRWSAAASCKIVSIEPFSTHADWRYTIGPAECDKVCFLPHHATLTKGGTFAIAGQSMTPD